MAKIFVTETLGFSEPPTFTQQPSYGVINYSASMNGKKGVYNSVNPQSEPGWNADVNDPGANSCVWGAVAAIPYDGPGTDHGIIGRIDPNLFGYLFHYDQSLAPNGLLYSLKDDAGTVVSGAYAGVDLITDNAQVVLISGQVDKAANRFRMRVSHPVLGLLGAQVDVSIAGFVTLLHGVDQRFGINAIPETAFNPFGLPTPPVGNGVFESYGFYVIGNQCEGAAVLRDLAVGLGFEM